LLKRAVAAAKKMLKPKGAGAATETEVDATTVVRRTYLRKKKAEDKADVPAILLEGDAPAPVTASGPVDPAAGPACSACSGVAVESAILSEQQTVVVVEHGASLACTSISTRAY